MRAKGDFVGIAAQVTYDGIGLFQIGLAVDHPVLLHQGIQALRHRFAIEPVQFPLAPGTAQGADHRAAKGPRQRLDRKQVVASGWAPLGLVLGQGAARNQTMQVHMLRQDLPPGVQYRSHAHVTVEPFWILPKGLDGVPDRLKQAPINHLGMTLHPGVECMRQE